jgi:hypothetical protein
MRERVLPSIIGRDVRHPVTVQSRPASVRVLGGNAPPVTSSLRGFAQPAAPSPVELQRVYDSVLALLRARSVALGFRDDGRPTQDDVKAAMGHANKLLGDVGGVGGGVSKADSSFVHSWQFCVFKLVAAAIACKALGQCFGPPTCEWPPPKPKDPCGGKCPPCTTCDPYLGACIGTLPPKGCSGQCCYRVDVTDPAYQWNCEGSTSESCGKVAASWAHPISGYPKSAVFYNCLPLKSPTGC